MNHKQRKHNVIEIHILVLKTASSGGSLSTRNSKLHFLFTERSKVWSKEVDLLPVVK